MRMIWIMLLMSTAAAHADVYRSIDANGEVVYSDRPTQGAERVKMPPLPSYTPPRVRSIERSAPARKQQLRYKSFVITAPVNGTTIRNNPGTLEIETQLAPALMTAQGHRIQYYLNGVAHGAALDNTTQTLRNVDRGEQRLSAGVVDAAGSVLISTAETTVYVKRASKLHGGRQGSVTDNPGYITDNPNNIDADNFQPYMQKDIADFSGNAADNDDPEFAEQPANPGYRNRNPNILSPNPNIHSANPYLINPPRPTED